MYIMEKKYYFVRKNTKCNDRVECAFVLVLRKDQVTEVPSRWLGSLRLNRKDLLMVEKLVRRVCRYWTLDSNLNNSVLWSDSDFPISGVELHIHQAHRGCLSWMSVYNLP